MQLLRAKDLNPHADVRICRQGRLAGTVGISVLVAILAGAPVFWWRVGMPWFIWGLCALLAVVVVPLLIGDLLAKFRPTNWLLRYGPKGIWIHLRSYQQTGPEEGLSVVHLEYNEITAVGEHVERYTTPSGSSGSSSTQHKLHSLDIRLNHDQTQELADALDAQRQQKSPERVYLGFITVLSRPTHFAVSLPDAETIRIAWYGGHNNWVSPSLRKVLQDLSRYVQRAEPTRYERGDWRQLSEAELDEQILQLVQSGDRIEAMQILVRRRGLSTTDAHRFVEELAGRV